jgi:hypothetical protein
MNLREEINQVLTTVKEHAYLTGITKPRDSEIASIFMVIEKRIDSIMQREISDSHHFEIQQAKNDVSTIDAIVRICREIKDELRIL